MLNRVEFLIATAVIAAARAANTADSADESETELSKESRERIRDEVERNTSQGQRISLARCLQT